MDINQLSWAEWYMSKLFSTYHHNLQLWWGSDKEPDVISLYSKFLADFYLSLAWQQLAELDDKVFEALVRPFYSSGTLRIKPSSDLQQDNT